MVGTSSLAEGNSTTGQQGDHVKGYGTKARVKAIKQLN